MLRSTKCLPLTAFRRTPSSFHNDNPESTEDVIKDVLEKALTCMKKVQYEPYLGIGSCLACVYRIMDAREKFGEHERGVRVARGAAENNSSFLRPLQTSQVHP